jgi:hypothetical protein
MTWDNHDADFIRKNELRGMVFEPKLWDMNPKCVYFVSLGKSIMKKEVPMTNMVARTVNRKGKSGQVFRIGWCIYIYNI